MTSILQRLFLLACATLLFVAPVRAAEVLPEVRFAESYRNGSDVSLLEVAWYGRAPSWTRAAHLEIAAGSIRDAERRHAFVFVGPVWDLWWPERAWFAEASFGPTLLTGSTVRGRELGGRFHFRSAFAIGRSFGIRHNLRLALRISHMSNGGIKDDNPGLDFVGLSLAGGLSVER